MVPRATSEYKTGKEEEVEEQEEASEENELVYCGLDTCRPSCMQGCAAMGCMTVALSFAGLCTSTLNIYINSQITTLERQFGFSSSVSGILLSCNDLGYLLTTLLASYLTRRVHIPRALSLSTLLFGLSGLLCAVPFFATRGDLPPTPQLLPSLAVSPNSPTQGLGDPAVNVSKILSSAPGTSLYLCLASHDNVTSGQLTNGTACPGGPAPARGSAVSERGKDMAVTLIALGMVLQGFGKSPRQPFIGTYVDDNVPKTRTTLYIGIITTVSMFGPVFAYAMGGLFNRFYVTLEATGMSMIDPRWIGAWWLGFLLFGTLGVLAAIPTLFFPKQLRPQPHLRLLERNQRLAAARHGRSLYDLQAFARTMLRLFRTPVYMLTAVGTCIFFFGISGTMSFHPKYLETQFQIPVWKANTLIGFVCAVAAAAGTLLGGVVTSRLKLSPVACLKLMVALTAATSVLASVGFVLGCEQPAISKGSWSSSSLSHARGIDPSQLSLPGGRRESRTLPEACSSSCSCDPARFFPVCGRDGVTYFSPCHAGCTKAVGLGYGSCSCIKSTSDNSSQQIASSSSSSTSASRNGSVPAASEPSSPPSGTPEARAGLCDSLCGRLYPYVFLSFCYTLTSSFVIMPAFYVILRSVSELDKPLAIGLSAFLTNLFGWFLGPIVHGRVVDSCCLLWGPACGRPGSCRLYNLALFRYRHHLMFVGAHVGAFVAFGLALLITVCGRGTFDLQLKDCEAAVVATPEVEGEKLVTRNGFAAEERETTGTEEESRLDGSLPNGEEHEDKI